MNNAVIVFTYTGDLLLEKTVGEIVSIIRSATHSTEPVLVKNATDDDFADFAQTGIANLCLNVQKKTEIEMQDFTPEENAIIYIYGIFNGNFTEMFPTRLAIKLSGKSSEDPLVKAVKIIGNSNITYRNLRTFIRNKYKITKQTFEEIREVSHMLYG